MAEVLQEPDVSLSELDRRSVLHPFTRVSDYAAGLSPAPIIIEQADGLYVQDSTGRKLLDGFSSLYCVNVGYGQQRIVDAMAAQAQKLPFFHVFAGMTHKPVIQLAEKLLEIAHGSMSRVFFGSSGSDANDTQVKLVWYYNNVRGKPRKKKIIARERGYHGGTIVTSSLTGLSAYHQGFDLFKEITLQTLAPDSFWLGDLDDSACVRHCVEHLEWLIEKHGADTIGAFIAEPMIGAGGLVPPPEGYWPAIQAVLRKHDILLILDEVVTGFGRVGAMLGCDVWGIEPDLMTLAKGLTSGYAPLSAVMVGPRVWEVLEQGTALHGMFGHGFTYSAHPVCAAAALANIAVIEDDKLCQNAQQVGAYLLYRLQTRLGDLPLVGQVRGVGLAAAIEFVAEGSPRRRLSPDLRFAARVNNMALEEGLLARTMPFGDIIGLAPALVLTREDADLMVEKLGNAIERASATLSPTQRMGHI